MSKEQEKVKKEAGEKETIKIETLNNIPDVIEVPVVIMDKDTKYKAIIRNKDNVTQSIVTDDYQLVKHRDVWNQIDGVSKEKDFVVNNASLYRYGNAMVVELGDKKPVDIPIFEGDEIRRGVRIFNSYDKSKALSVESYGLRLVCTNGMIAPGFVKRYSRTHSYTNIDIGELGKYIELGMEAWALTADLLRQSAKKQVKAEPIIKRLEFPVKYHDDIIGKVEMDGEYASVYNIWNAITNVITHQMSDHVQTKRLLKYQRRANSVFDVMKKEVVLTTP